MFISTQQLLRIAKEKFIQTGATAPFISLPVLRESEMEAKQPCIALLVLPESVGTVDAPHMYEEYSLTGETAGYVKFHSRKDALRPQKLELQKEEIKEETLARLAERFDRIRQMAQETNPSEWLPEYKRYLTKALSYTPAALVPFVKDLADYKKEENEEKKKKQPEWRPERNLSEMEEEEYRRYLALSSHIEILECAEPEQIRFSYPILCRKDDLEGDGPVWDRLLRQAEAHRYALGRYRVKNDRIYSHCAEPDCLFRVCPYVIAAYIKYLRTRYPKELEKQRKENK